MSLFILPLFSISIRSVKFYSLTNSTSIGIVNSVGYPFGISKSFEIIEFSVTVKETSKVGNHPV